MITLTPEQEADKLNAITSYEDYEVQITKTDAGEFWASIACDCDSMILDTYVRLIPISGLPLEHNLPEKI